MIPLKRLEITADFIKRYAAESPFHGNIVDTFRARAILRLQRKKSRFLGQTLQPERLFGRPGGKRRTIAPVCRGNVRHIRIHEPHGRKLPVSVMEAMSCGIVPLCADAGGTSEAVDGTVGALIPNSPSFTMTSAPQQTGLPKIT